MLVESTPSLKLFLVELVLKISVTISKLLVTLLILFSIVVSLFLPGIFLSKQQQLTEIAKAISIISVNLL